MNQKISLGVIVILIAAVGYFAFLKNSEPTSMPAQQDTSDWKTYTNTAYGFQLTVTDAWKGYRVTNTSPRSFAIEVPTTDKTWDGGRGWADRLRINIYSTSEWQKIQTEEGPKPGFLAQNNQYVFTYSQWQDAPQDLLNIDFEIPQVLSTFKLIESLYTSSWKTYVNTQHGFEVQYPSALSSKAGTGDEVFWFGRGDSVFSMISTEPESGGMPQRNLFIQIFADRSKPADKDLFSYLSSDELVREQDKIGGLKLTKTTVARLSAIKVEYGNGFGYFIEKSPVKFVKIDITSDASGVERDEYLQIADQIIATFKLTR